MPIDKPVKVEAVVSFDDKTVADTKSENERNHATQEGIRNATWSAVVAASIYALITIGVWCEMRKTTKTSQGQLAVMQDSNRPWVKVEVSASIYPSPIPTAPLSFNSAERANLPITFRLTNIGNSVATDVSIREKDLALSFVDDGQRPFKEQEDLCKPERKAGVVYTLFPKEEQTEGTSAAFDATTVTYPKDGSFGTFKLGKPIVPLVIGCVIYKYAFSDVPHQTGFIFQMYGNNNNQGIQIGGTYPADQIVFKPYAFGGKYAN
jgi:hypothetical protein